MRPWKTLSGLNRLGDVTAGQIASVGGGATSIAATGASSAPTGTKIIQGVGAGLMTAAPFTGPAAPFVAVAGLVAEMLAAFGVGSGCGQACVLSSQYANKAESILQQNMATYFSIPSPRVVSQQQAALLIFDTIWNDLKTQCSNPALSTAGRNCISDRQSGACKWRANTSPYPGTPAAGDCWNWFNGYRDPIANDPVVADSVSSSLSSLGISLPNNLLLIGGIALLAFAFMGGQK
jgi:hypothetical protein